jgi:hypothetical protein
MKIFGYPRDDFSGLHLGFPWMNIGINPERNGWRIKKKNRKGSSTLWCHAIEPLIAEKQKQKQKN